MKIHNTDILKMTLIDNVGRKSIIKLTEHIINNKIENLIFRDYIDLLQEITGRNIVFNYDKLLLEEDRILNKCIRGKISIIGLFDRDYPERFHEMKEDKPVLFFAKGNTDIIYSGRNVAVIGTREPSSNGYKTAYAYAKNLSEKKHNIISGLASGCDTAAHLAAVENGGLTLAAIPTGIGLVYPKENISLYNKILSCGGCIISEKIPEEPPLIYDFIERDRLQAALSEVVIVVESLINGGTAHTASFADKYGKRILCSFHNTEEKNIQLNRKLVDDNKGVEIKSIQEMMYNVKKIIGEKDYENHRE